MVKKTKKEQAEALSKICEIMQEHGEECGNAISDYLKRVHPKALVIPLYRSAVAIEKKGEGQVQLFACGDPHCMGEELDDKTLASWTREWFIIGQRFGPEMMHFIGESVEQRINL